MKTLKRYKLAIITLLMLPTVVWADDYIKIMGTVYTSDNMSADEVTVQPSSEATLSSGTITYNKVSHTVTLDGVVAHCNYDTEFISNRRTDMSLTVIVNSACTISGWYIIDIDNQGDGPSHPTDLTVKSANNQPVDLNITTSSADFIITAGSVDCKLINLNINCTCLNDANRSLIYFKHDNPTVEIYNCYISVDKLFHTDNSANPKIDCYGMKWLSGDNQGTPFVFKREINRNASTKTEITNVGNFSLTETPLATPVTSSITPLADLQIAFGGGSMTPADGISVENSAETKACNFSITLDDIYSYLPYKNAGNDYKFFLSETETAIVTEDNPIEISYNIVSKSVTSDDISVTDIPTQIYDGTNAVTPIVYIYDNGSLLTKDVDYTVSYASNEAEGTASVTITGKGNYTGTKTLNFDIVSEYFSEGGISYHTISSTAVAVGNSINAAATTLTGVVTVPDNITHVLATPFTVTGIEKGAFKNCTGIKGINMENNVNLQFIEDGVFEGCTALRYIDLSNASAFEPTSLQRDIEVSPFYGVPKQALVYLNGTSIKGENYVYKVGDEDYRCSVFKIYDDLSGTQKQFAEVEGYKWAFENPHSFTAYSIVNTRKLTGDSYYTTCLPYSLPIPNGVRAYTLGVASDKLIGFEEVTGTMATCTPYVLFTTTTGQLLGTENALVPAFTATDEAAKKLNPASTVGEDPAKFTMGGTMRYIDGADAEGLYIMQGKDANGVNSWKLIQDANGSYADADHRYCVLPMRAYIKSGAALSRPLLGSSFVNGVSEIQTADRRENADVLYDLLGRRLQGSHRKGIYILGGRKVCR